MRISNLLEKLSDHSGPSKSAKVCAYAVDLLKIVIKEDGGVIEDLPESDSKFADFIVPEGFGKFKGPLVVKVSSGTYKDVFFSFIHHFSNLGDSGDDNVRATCFLFVNLVYTEGRKPDGFMSSFNKDSFPGLNVYVEDANFIDSISSVHSDKANEIIENLFFVSLESYVNKSPSDWREERDNIILELGRAFSKGQLSLILGAGVSSSVGLPNWANLLNTLFIKYLTEEFSGDKDISNDYIRSLVDRLSSLDEGTALMTARYLRKGLSQNGGEAKEFTKLITRSLYGSSDAKLTSPLLEEVTALCMPRRAGANINSVINYNFDDLLEQSLESRKALFKPIYLEGDTHEAEELPIYHVHGFLPRHSKSYRRVDDSEIIFSEESYHKVFTDAYHWSNLVQLNTFRENSCLMIGLSMTDPNLRRLLDISSRSSEKSRHYAFVKRLSNDEFCYDNEALVKEGSRNKFFDNTSFVDEFLDIHNKLQEKLMSEMGVNIIWYEDYTDIPRIIGTIDSIFDRL